MPLDNQALMPGVAFLESLATPSFAPKAHAVPQITEEPLQHHLTHSKVSDQVSKTAALPPARCITLSLLPDSCLRGNAFFLAMT